MVMDRTDLKVERRDWNDRRCEQDGQDQLRAAVLVELAVLTSGDEEEGECQKLRAAVEEGEDPGGRNFHFVAKISRAHGFCLICLREEEPLFVPPSILFPQGEGRASLWEALGPHI